jgi:hypothetical protein
LRYVLTHEDLVEKLQQQVGFLRRSAALFDDGHQDEAFRLAGAIRTLVHDTGASHSLLGQLGVKDTISFLDTAEPIDPRNLAPTLGLVQAWIEYGPAGTVGSYEAPLAGDPPKKKPGRRPPPGSRKKSKRRRKSRPATKTRPSDLLVVRGVSLVEAIPGEAPAEEPPPHDRRKRFEDWWTGPVTKDSKGSLFTRRDYVLAGANKEGGTHVDPALEASCAELTRSNTLNYHVDSEGLAVTIGSREPGDEEVDLGNPAPASIRQVAYEIDQTLRGELADLLAATR